MTYFGFYLKNGALNVGGGITASGPVIGPAGSTAAPGIQTSTRTGLYSVNANTLDLSVSGVNGVHWTAGESRQASDWDLSFSATTNASGGAADVYIHREAANTIKMFDGTTNASTLLIGSIDIRQAASTFAQTATITNGPRAANPVAWVEVKVSGTTGRIPVW